MLKPAGGKKDEALSSGYSGKTQAILRDALRKSEVGVAKLPVTFADGEDKAALTFFVEGPEAAKTWVTHGKSADPMVVEKQVKAHAPLSDQPLPDLTRVPREVGAVMAAIRAHQDAVTLDMVQREAGREGLRRVLLEREIVPWRREQMEKTFNAQRTEAHAHLSATMAHFKAEAEVYQKRFGAMSAAADRIDAINARKAASERADAEAGIQ